MTDVDTTRRVAERVRRQTRNADIIALCDVVLSTPAPVLPVPGKTCPVCAARRAAKAAAQKRWRRGSKEIAASQ